MDSCYYDINGLLIIPTTTGISSGVFTRHYINGEAVTADQYYNRITLDAHTQTNSQSSGYEKIGEIECIRREIEQWHKSVLEK